MDLYTSSMTAEIEHRRLTSRAEQPWRRVEPAARGTGPIGRLRALFAGPREQRTERTAARSAGSPAHECRPVGAS